MGRVSGVAVGAVAAGMVLVWSGLNGTSVLVAVQSIISGKKPDPNAQTNPIITPAAPSPTPPGGKAPGSGSNGGGIPGSSGVPLPRINPPNSANGFGAGGDKFTDPRATTPKTAPPLPAPNPPTHISQGTPYPWYDPRGWGIF